MRRRSVSAFLAAGVLASLISNNAARAEPTIDPGSPVPPAASPAGDPAATHPTSPAGTLPAGRYVVTLRDVAVASYEGGVPGYAPTSPDVTGTDVLPTTAPVAAYAALLRDRQTSLTRRFGVTPTSSYTFATNGFSATLTSDQATALRADPQVSAVTADEIVRVAATTSTDFLGLSGPNGVWAQQGGVARAGRGVVVGVIDSGIAPDNASFAGAALGTRAGTEPYRNGDEIVFAKADGRRFVGTCTTGQQFTTADCSTKIVGARYFGANFGYANIGNPSQGEYRSPRDGSGHGSHTSSTAAGDHGVAAHIGDTTLGDISGVAPAAKIAVYKGCWSGQDPAGSDDDGCAVADLLEAIDAAVSDGVDVINYSIGGGGTSSTVSLTDAAFLNAAAAGIFVSAAGGNSGPDPVTVDNDAPWITTVAASTIPNRDATVELGNGTALLGASITVPTGRPVTGPVVLAAAIGLPGASSPRLCGPGTLDPAKARGRIVVCERGTVDRVAKSAEVARVKGIGMILVNPEPNSLDLDTHSVPTVALDADSYAPLLAYAQRAGATATLVEGNTTGRQSAPVPQVAGFSSRGPVDVDGGDLIKPDLAAPGVGILAAFASAAGAPGTYAFESGTSMAAPHVAGLAALYLGLHPKASPSEIKSALMTTARPTVDSDGTASTDVFAQGAGQVDPTGYLDPGFYYRNGTRAWKAYAQAVGADHGATSADPSDLNLPSIAIGSLAGTQTVTRTVTATAAGTWTAAPVQMPGVTVVVSPTTLTLDAPGSTASYRVTFTRTDAALGEYSTGYLTWTSSTAGAVRSALAVRPVALAVPEQVSGTGRAGHVDLPVSGGDRARIPLTLTGLAAGERVNGVSRVGAPVQSFVVDVADGATFARFSLDGAAPDADLDLAVSRLNPFGVRLPAGTSASPGSDETVDLEFPFGGTYVVDVIAFASTGDVGFELTSFVLEPTHALGSFTATPPAVTTTVGRTSSARLSWSGLSAGAAYLGRVALGDTGLVTTVLVDTPAAATPAVRPVSLTTDQRYVRPGALAVVRGAGLRPGAGYTVSIGDAGPTLATGTVDANGEVARVVTVPASTATGATTFQVRSGSRSASAGVVVTPLVIAGASRSERLGFDGRPVVGIDTNYKGDGRIRTVVVAADGRTALDRIDTLSDVVSVPSIPWSSVRVAVVAGTVTARVSVLAADGSTLQSLTRSWTARSRPASSVALTATAGARGSVDVTIRNNTGELLEPTLRYKLTAGPLVLSSLYIPDEDYAVSHPLDGVDHVDLVLGDTVLATYRNPFPNRTRPVIPQIVEDFWVTVSSASTGDSARPLTMVVSNRYAAYSAGFELTVGVGTSIYSSNPFYYEAISVPVVDAPGPVITRRVAVPTAQPLWIAAYYEIHRPDGFQALALRRQLVQPVRAAELRPVSR